MLRAFVFACFIIGVFFLTTKTIEAVADWFQWVVDDAYNKGRAVERICSSNDIPDICERHNQNSGHNIYATPLPAHN